MRTVRVLHAVGCVVTNPWEGIDTLKNSLRVLINPANESLLGTARPYFPRGGPLPPRAPPGLTTSSRWGGMDAGSGMLYPAQAVDGLVHQHGGHRLRDLLLSFPVLEARPDGEHVRCRVGDTVLTPSPPNLSHFDIIAHTPPPFWSSNLDSSQGRLWQELLSACYSSALRASANAAAVAGKTQLQVATPILGSGARGAPIDAAARVLASVVARSQQPLPVLLRVVVASKGCACSLQRAITEHEGFQISVN